MPTYGLRVTNNNEQIIIDSDEGFPHFIEVDSTTIVSGNDNEVDFPTGFEFNKLIFARPTESCMIMEAGNTGGARAFYRSVSSSPIQLIRADVTSGNVADHDDGYGLNVFDGSAAASASTLVFSTNTSSSLDIRSVGDYNDIAPNHTINVIINSTAPHYVLLPGSYTYTYNEAWSGPFGGASFYIEQQRGYQFNYTGNHLDSIDILNKIMSTGGGILTTTPLGYGGGAYMIVELRS